jgi:hypothetical protein
MLKYFLEIYHFYTFQGYELQYAIENIDVHLILTKYIWVWKRGYFSPAHCWKHPQSPWELSRETISQFWRKLLNTVTSVCKVKILIFLYQPSKKGRMNWELCPNPTNYTFPLWWICWELLGWTFMQIFSGSYEIHNMNSTVE